jgi:cyclic beta-1,2-glucan glucanotransferase
VVPFSSTRYEIAVENPEHRCSGVAEVELDGKAVDPSAIPLRDDGRKHSVRAVIGTPVPAERSLG